MNTQPLNVPNKASKGSPVPSKHIISSPSAGRPSSSPAPQHLSSANLVGKGVASALKHPSNPAGLSNRKPLKKGLLPVRRRLTPNLARPLLRPLRSQRQQPPRSEEHTS